MQRPVRPVLDRLADKFTVGDGCWAWTAGTVGGYGTFRAAGKVRKAHRVVYELLVGPIPEGLDLDHLCRNRACVRPSHLEPVTRRENILRGEGLGAKRARQTHCKRGHELVEPNIYTTAGNRACRACAIARSKAAYRRSMIQGA